MRRMATVLLLGLLMVALLATAAGAARDSVITEEVFSVRASR